MRMYGDDEDGGDQQTAQFAAPQTRCEQIIKALQNDQPATLMTQLPRDPAVHAQRRGGCPAKEKSPTQTPP